MLALAGEQLWALTGHREGEGLVQARRDPTPTLSQQEREGGGFAIVRKIWTNYESPETPTLGAVDVSGVSGAA